MKPNTIFYHIFLTFFLMLAAENLAAQELQAKSSADLPIAVYGIETEHTDANFYIRFKIDLSGIKIKSEKQLLLTPVLQGENNCVELPGVIIAGHNRYIRHLRHKSVPKGYSLFRSGHAPSSMSVDQRLPFEDWMLNARIVMKDTLSGCSCRPIRSSEYAISYVDVDMKDNATNFRAGIFNPEFVYVEPVVDVKKMREAKGKAFIDFPLNKTEIYPDYRNNPKELSNIKDTISMIKNDLDYVITSISLKGFASPEGPYDNNEYLAKERTYSLRDYIQSLYDFSPSIMHVSWEAEDWKGLINWLKNSSIENKRALLWVATTDKYDGDYDRREWILKSEYPEQYKWLLTNVYPSLRHTDYTIEYSIKTFTTLEEIVEAWNDDPRKMSLNELFVLASSYPSDSQEAIEVFETAAALNPHSSEANLNAGVSALQNGDLSRAERYLKKAGDQPEASYARGILAIKKENYDEAIPLIKSAAVSGLTQAQDALSQLQSIKSFPEE